MPQTNNLDQVRSLLERDRIWSAYALGDLSPGLVEDCEWHVSGGDSPAVLMLYRGFSAPVLFTMGEYSEVSSLLDEINGETQLHLRIPTLHLPLLQARYVVEEIPMIRMQLDLTDFQQLTELPLFPTQLSENDLAALQSLYSDGEPSGEAPDFFLPSMLADGIYYGVFEGDELLAAAGTHFVAPEVGVGTVGNIYTRKDCRGQGLAFRVTHAVTSGLIKRGIETVVLNVHPNNSPALKVYEKIGFRPYCGFYEGSATQK